METRDVHALLGRTAYDADGDSLGTVAGAYLDHATGRPSWITVERGGLLRGSRRTFVPLDGAERVDDGVRVAVDGDAVRRAPQVDDDKVLSREQESQLRGHYGLAAPSVPGSAPDAGQGAMTLSEERPRVTTSTVPTTRAVLRRTRVVEDRTFSVPLGRDEVQVAYEPLPDARPAPATTQPSPASAQDVDDTQDADDEGWVVLYEERLVVRTEWVPVERVRLGAVGVQGEEVVQVDLRRERVDVDMVDVRDARGVDDVAGPSDGRAVLPGPADARTP